VHVESEGAPAHARETGDPNRPSLGFTVTLKVAVCPAVMLALAGELLRLKSAPSLTMKVSVGPFKLACTGELDGKSAEPVWPVT
jgi:hypothetical protein